MNSTEQTEALLMRFIKDGYSASGKVSKKTATEMMKYVANDKELQFLVNIGDKSKILNHRTGN